MLSGTPKRLLKPTPRTAFGVIGRLSYQAPPLSKSFSPRNGLKRRATVCEKNSSPLRTRRSPSNFGMFPSHLLCLVLAADRTRYEYQDAHDGMKWKRCYGLEDWTFAEDGKMRKRQMSGNDVEITEAGKLSLSNTSNLNHSFLCTCDSAHVLIMCRSMVQGRCRC